MVRAAGGKPVWMTLQIAWSGTVASAKKPNVVPRFPTLHELRFMAYQAIVCGARGLLVLRRPPDAGGAAGRRARRLELDVLGPGAAAAARGALVDRRRAGARRAERARPSTTTAKDVDLVTRRDGRFLYLIAARRGGATSRVGFTGLPKKLDGSPIAGGQVLFEYVQEPLPPPIGAGQPGVPIGERRGRRLPRLVRAARRPRLPLRPLDLVGRPDLVSKLERVILSDYY